MKITLFEKAGIDVKRIVSFVLVLTIVLTSCIVAFAEPETLEVPEEAEVEEVIDAPEEVEEELPKEEEEVIDAPEEAPEIVEEEIEDEEVVEEIEDEEEAVVEEVVEELPEEEILEEEVEEIAEDAKEELPVCNTALEEIEKVGAGKTQIDAVSITMNTPTMGDKVAEYSVSGGTGYKIEKIEWSLEGTSIKLDGKGGTPNVTFGGVGQYTAIVKLTAEPKQNYEFKAPFSVTLNGSSVQSFVKKDPSEKKIESITFSAVFGPLGKTLETPEAGDFTVTLPQEPVYDGTSKEAIVNVKVEVDGMGEYTVAYKKNNTVVDSIDAGTYEVVLNIEEGTTYAAATLTDAAWTFTIAPQTIGSLALTLDGPEKDATSASRKLGGYDSEKYNAELTWAGTLDGAQKKFKYEEVYTATAVITLKDTNYIFNNSVATTLNSENIASVVSPDSLSITVVKTFDKLHAPSITVVTYPALMDYKVGEKFSPAGLWIKFDDGKGNVNYIEYANGNGISCKPDKELKKDEETITVEYKYQTQPEKKVSTTFAINLYPKLSVKQLNNTYAVGETIATPSLILLYEPDKDHDYEIAYATATPGCIKLELHDEPKNSMTVQKGTKHLHIWYYFGTGQIPDDITKKDAKDTIEYRFPLTVLQSQNAPTSPNANDETILGIADGKITGLTTDMEYRSSGSSIYTTCTSTTLNNLAAGTYFCSLCC